MRPTVGATRGFAPDANNTATTCAGRLWGNRNFKPHSQPSTT